MSVLGKQTNVYEGLDIIELTKIADRIVFVSDEVQAMCPVTNQPDLYKVEIILMESPVTIESKSLKLFFMSLRNEGIFAENLPNRLLNEILHHLQDCRPDGIGVEVNQKSRGGITIQACVAWTKPREDMTVDLLRKILSS